MKQRKDLNTTEEVTSADSAPFENKVKPRFHYRWNNPWSKDKTIKYFQGSWNKVIWPGIKLLLFIGLIVFLVFAVELTFLQSFGIGLFVILIYQEIVARMFGLIRMPAMDQTTFISATAAHINFMSITGIEGDLDREWYENYFRTTYIDRYPKFS